MPLNIQTGKTNRAQKVIAYGVEKIGKTTLISKAAPKPLFFDLENGTDLIDLDRVKIGSCSELIYNMVELVKNQLDYKTVVFDSVDAVERLLAEKVCKDNSWKNLKAPGYGDGFVVFRDEWNKFLFSLDALTRAGIHVVLIGHARIANFTAPDSTETYNRYELQLDKENSITTKSWADAILFCNYRTTVVEGNDKKAHATGGKDRIIYTERCAAFDAGNRHGLADKLKFAPESIAPIFSEVKLAATQDPSPVTVHLVKEAIKTLEANEVNQVEKAAEELTKQSTTEEVDPSVSAFIEATMSLDQKALEGFLVNRKELAPGAPLTTVKPAYAKRAMGAIENFKQCVEKFAKGELK
jgi:hypothetical protein